MGQGIRDGHASFVFRVTKAAVRAHLVAQHEGAVGDAPLQVPALDQDVVQQARAHHQQLWWVCFWKVERGQGEWEGMLLLLVVVRRIRPRVYPIHRHGWRAVGAYPSIYTYVCVCVYVCIYTCTRLGADEDSAVLPGGHVAVVERDAHDHGRHGHAVQHALWAMCGWVASYGGSVGSARPDVIL